MQTPWSFVEMHVLIQAVLLGPVFSNSPSSSLSYSLFCVSPPGEWAGRPANHIANY